MPKPACSANAVEPCSGGEAQRDGNGAKTLIVKRGEYGVLHDVQWQIRFWRLPPFRWKAIYDPTGAGDTFAGGFMGALAQADEVNERAFRRSIIFGSTMASFNVEKFGLERLTSLTRSEIDDRFRQFKALAAFRRSVGSMDYSVASPPRPLRRSGRIASALSVRYGISPPECAPTCWFVLEPRFSCSSPSRLRRSHRRRSDALQRKADRLASGFLGAGAVLHARGFVVSLHHCCRNLGGCRHLGMAVGSGYYGIAVFTTVLSIDIDVDGVFRREAAQPSPSATRSL